jgi:hypothetical protein
VAESPRTRQRWRRLRHRIRSSSSLQRAMVATRCGAILHQLHHFVSVVVHSTCPQAPGCAHDGWPAAVHLRRRCCPQLDAEPRSRLQCSADRCQWQTCLSCPSADEELLQRWAERRPFAIVHHDGAVRDLVAWIAAAADAPQACVVSVQALKYLASAGRPLFARGSAERTCSASARRLCACCPLFWTLRMLASQPGDSSASGGSPAVVAFYYLGH